LPVGHWWGTQPEQSTTNPPPFAVAPWLGLKYLYPGILPQKPQKSPTRNPLRATRIRTAWFEILGVGEGSNQATSFNMVVDTRAAKKGGKHQSNSFENRFLSKALMPIQELGVKETETFFDPVPIETPPEWLDSFFETLAGMLEDRNIIPVQLNETEMRALAQAAYLEASTPKTPPKPPPIMGLGWKKRL
jgi:hypothetical protein